MHEFFKTNKLNNYRKLFVKLKIKKKKESIRDYFKKICFAYTYLN